MSMHASLERGLAQQVEKPPLHCPGMGLVTKGRMCPFSNFQPAPHPTESWPSGAPSCSIKPHPADSS